MDLQTRIKSKYKKIVAFQSVIENYLPLIQSNVSVNKLSIFLLKYSRIMRDNSSNLMCHTNVNKLRTQKMYKITIQLALLTPCAAIPNNTCIEEESKNLKSKN